MKIKILYTFIVIIVLTLISYVIFKTNEAKQTVQATKNDSQMIQVVAAENFYGDIAQQLGGIIYRY